MAVLEEYTCSMCGVTIENCHQWGPRCRKTGKRVCDACCFRCEHHIKFSGIWSCNFITPEKRREEVRKRAQQRFDDENKRISDAFLKRRREMARRRATKSARAGAKRNK